MFVAMITAFIFVFVLIALTNKKENVTTVDAEETVAETSTNWDLLFAKIEQDNADILAQEELAEIVGSLTEEIGKALDARKYDGIEAIEDIKLFVGALFDEEWCEEHQLDSLGIDIKGTWIHSIPEKYLTSFSSVEDEVCVSSIENGSVFNDTFPALVVSGTCRRLFSGNIGSTAGKQRTRSWFYAPHKTPHDEGWATPSQLDIKEVLVSDEEMKVRVEALGFQNVVVVPSDYRTFIWDRYQVPASKRGVTPSNTIEKEIK